MERLDIISLSPPNFEILFSFPNFLRSSTLSCLATCEATCVQNLLDINYRFTCGELNFGRKTVNCKDIMSLIADFVETHYCRTDVLKYLFSFINFEWNDSVLQKSLLKFTQPRPNLVHKIHVPLELKLLKRLRLGFSHLNKRRFNHIFKNCINPLYSCSFEVELAKYFFPALPLLH